jgi:hypothetical protein
MLKFRSAPSPEDFSRSADQPSQRGFASASEPRTFQEARHLGLMNKMRPSAEPQPLVRRALSPVDGRALEILGHAIEYLADEYSVDTTPKGRLGSADPRVEAIQVLKSLNRAIYYSGAEVQPAFRRIKRWVLGTRTT